ncbi:L-aminoadipate-semialdehyde dehydrogenase-phosphopantetheinyl transferase [Lates japonicus]|uniref:L-aminoadipate-semialdehyde dehydrogenase-phosphopantetheinyl transferase n=1 Tax=Lates japonicus TaxID=270547 RepID=A0AAD3NFQ2_LATJO|nr:L-aminoadipate-semialdehyde dehydrogenase-phosphopantetheinyl transferase [Lates japonicus]
MCANKYDSAESLLDVDDIMLPVAFPDQPRQSGTTTHVILHLFLLLPHSRCCRSGDLAASASPLTEEDPAYWDNFKMKS